MVVTVVTSLIAPGGRSRGRQPAQPASPASRIRFVDATQMDHGYLAAAKLPARLAGIAAVRQQVLAGPRR
jgi:hypothetical protein